MAEIPDHSVALLDRPEPHFVEGRQWPDPGWQGRILWLSLAVMLSGATVAAYLTRMVVPVEASGSVVNGPDEMQVVLLADPDPGRLIGVGQPVRLDLAHRIGWGIVLNTAKIESSLGEPFIQVTVAIVDTALGAVAGEACQGRALVGYTPTIVGLWRLATNQPGRPTYGEPAQLRRRIPDRLRDSDRYRRIEQQLNSSL